MVKNENGQPLKLGEFLIEGGEKELPEVSFENGISLLEELVTKVESGSMPLEKAILSYERGSSLISHLRGLLSGAEEKLKILQRPSGNGQK